MARRQTDDQYSDEEAQRRFGIALRAALNMPHKPHKAAVGKGRESKRKTAEASVPQAARAKRRP